MPLYNAEEFVLNSVGSILKQTLSDFEFIIIDDGSIDKSVQLIKNMNDSRIKIICRSHCGIAQQLNYGLKIAVAPIIARMDSDDYAYPTRLEEQYSFLENNKEIGVVGTGYELIDVGGKILGKKIMPQSDKSLKELLPVFCPFLHPAVMFRKNIIVAAGGYNETFVPNEDYELWLRLSDTTKYASLPKVLIKKRVRDTNLTNMNKSFGKKQRLEIITNHCFVKLSGLKNKKERIRLKVNIAKGHYYYGNMNMARKLFFKIIFEAPNNIIGWRFFIPSLLGDSIFSYIRGKKLVNRLMNVFRKSSFINKYLSP